LKDTDGSKMQVKDEVKDEDKTLTPPSPSQAKDESGTEAAKKAAE
jgi:hypothetical protein